MSPTQPSSGSCWSRRLLAALALVVAFANTSIAAECRAPYPLRHKDPQLQTELYRGLARNAT